MRLKSMGTDTVRDVTPKAAGSDWFRKAMGFVVTRLSLVHREGWPIENSTAGEPVTAASVMGLSAAWSCVNVIAGTLGTLPFEVWRTNPRTGFPEAAPGHWLSILLRRPNLEQTRIDLLEYMSVSLELRGNAYVRKGRLTDAGRIVSLTPINPDDVYVYRDRNTRMIRYRVRDDRGQVEELTAREIWHVRGPGGDPLGGMSTIAFGRNSFGLSQALDKAASSTFRNGVKPSGVLSFQDWLTEPRRRDARKEIDGFKGAAEAGRPLVLEGGVTWQQLSFAPEEAQMLQSRNFGVEETCRWFGVPPVLAGHTEKVSAWGTGILEITQGWVKYGLRRRIKRLEMSGDQDLLSAQELGEGYFLRYNLDALLRADSAGRAKFYEIMTRAGLMTINECRKLEGLPPVPGGDVPRMQSQNVPIGAALTAMPVPTGGE